MIENDERTSVDRILGLASKWQIAEAVALINELSAPSESENFIACRALLNGISEMKEGRYELGIQEALPALTHLEQYGFRSLLDWAYSEVGFTFGMLGSPETGLEWVSRAIAGAERRSDEAQLRRSFIEEGRLLAMLHETEKSVVSFDKALALQDSAPSFEKVDNLNIIANTYIHFARREEQDANQRIDLAQKVVDLARSALSILDGKPNDRFQARSLENMASALSLLGNFVEAEAAFIKALPLSESYAHINVELLTSYAWLLCEMRRYEESDALLARAYARAQADKQETSIDRIFETRIRLEIRTGRNTEALIWSERRFRSMENHYRRHLTSVARNAEIFVDLEQARLVERETRERRDKQVTINKTLGPQSSIWKDETLRDALTGCLNQRGLMVSSESFLHPENLWRLS